jgi:hypothetical protein
MGKGVIGLSGWLVHSLVSQLVRMALVKLIREVYEVVKN